VKGLLLAVVAAFLASAPVARADEPTRQPIQVLPFFTDVCGYFLGVNPLEQDRVTTLFSDGSQITTGNLVVQVTHLDGGSKSIVLDVSGPLFFTGVVGANGSRTIEGTGNTLWVVDDAVYLVRGKATLVIDPNGTRTLSSVGYIENLCDTLR
jgi:hypothetical protein